MSSAIDDIVRTGLTLKMKQGQQVRLKHEYKINGEKCSIDKDPALIITKKSTCFVYICHSIL